MVSYYYKPGPRLGLPPVWKADHGLSLAAIDQLAKVEGLSVVRKPQGGLTPATIEELLRKHGPIWAAGHYLDGYPNAGHAIVLTGVEGQLVHYNDPWEPRSKTKPAHWIDSHLLNLPNALLCKDQTRS